MISLVEVDPYQVKSRFQFQWETKYPFGQV